ncbi:MAG: type III-B CRISPR-associated protein Cas10/Cmr2, partial [Cyanobacteria bacterium P01_A01_bin.17]
MTTQNQPSGNVQAFYARKLYALLRDSPHEEPSGTLFAALAQEIPELGNLGVETWWENAGPLLSAIGSASDRANLHPKSDLPAAIEVRHPISGQSQQLTSIQPTDADKRNKRIEAIQAAKAALDVANNPTETLKRLYWWCWRFYPELRENRETAFLKPAHRILPDCPIPSYNSTVAALSGAMFPSDWQLGDEAQKPHLLLFTFSPVQEFIKASRKFVDFWSGSYMLHYLSVKLCWHIAQEYGPDAVITPSLWGQEIIDALLVNCYSDFKSFFKDVENPDIDNDPVSLFNRRESASLSTAGFPNTITALVPSKEKAIALGQALQKELKTIWCDIAKQVREHIKGRVIDHLSNKGFDEAWDTLKDLFPAAEHDTYKKELRKYQQHGCWEWNKLWNAQIENTWQPYFVAVPLGHPENILEAASSNQDWIDQQNAIALTRESLPTAAEKQAYETLNVGTWWGSLQARLGQSMQAIKNTRRWQIPIAPGERSSLSGQFSALHPCLHYEGRLKHGRGMATGSIRMFWKLMSLAYPGLFDGSERLNAMELTKRMAWRYGGVAERLGISLEQDEEDFGKAIRFPNLTSIAAGRFASRHPEVIDSYWKELRRAIYQNASDDKLALTLDNHEKFCSVTHRSFQIKQADTALRDVIEGNHDYNGVMFSAKWLAEDMGLEKDATQELRGLVAQAHQKVNFADSSPSDWWVLLLADGDGMGQYVNGRNLHPYQNYLIEDLVNHDGIDGEAWSDFLTKTKKRMGPATHVGLNRALLDFSNRLVPHLTEHRFCGKVIYSGGDDVLVALPLADLPGYVRSLRAAWCGGVDPGGEEPGDRFRDIGDYWRPRYPAQMSHLPDRPLFTMGKGATMSMGIIIAHKSVPLPTVLENLWEAEKERAKKLLGGSPPDAGAKIPPKDGLCFRIVYGSGNTLEALMKGHLLELWWEMIKNHPQYDLSPVFNRLAEELPKHVEV